MEVLAQLTAERPGTPVIVISAMSDTRLAVRAVKSGAADYLTKPFELDELLDTMRITLQHRPTAKSRWGCFVHLRRCPPEFGDCSAIAPWTRAANLGPRKLPLASARNWPTPGSQQCKSDVGCPPDG